MNAESEMAGADGLGAEPVEWDGHLDESRSTELSDEEHADANTLAASLVGKWIRDGEGRAWLVEEFDTTGKDGWATVSGAEYWDRPENVEVIDPQPTPERKISDAEALDQLQRSLNAATEWNGGDVCEELAGALERTGRPIIGS